MRGIEGIHLSYDGMAVRDMSFHGENRSIRKNLSRSLIREAADRFANSSRRAIINS